MNANELSVADVEAILLDIHNLEKFINEKKQLRDQSIAFFRDRIELAKKNFEQDTFDAHSQIHQLAHTLETFFNAHPPTKRKTLKFTGGSFGYYKSSTKFFLNGQEVNSDNQDLIAFADNAYPQFIKTKKSLDWAKLKANLDFDNPETVFLKDTGEVIDGLSALKIFSVKTS